MVPFLIVLTFFLLLCTGMLVARRYGAIPTYIGFAWVIPVASIVWLKGESQLGFSESLLNLPFVLVVLMVSFVLSAGCFPAILASNKESLSAGRVAGLSVAALLHGIPFLLCVMIYLFVIFFGK